MSILWLDGHMDVLRVEVFQDFPSHTLLWMMGQKFVFGKFVVAVVFNNFRFL